MGQHAFGATLNLSGIATATVRAIDGTLSQQPYQGTCYLCVWPPNSATYNKHTLTSSSTGAWSFDVHKTEPGYTSGRWKYRIDIEGATDGASFDLYFDVNESFVQTVQVAI
jgi:hypothetical protein